MGAGKIKYCKIYNGSALLLDLIPVKRKSDNKICMYDKISGQYYLNAGSGSFIAGPEIKDIELVNNINLINNSINYCFNLTETILKDEAANYIKLEYIEGTGTQFIDTGLKAESGIKFHIKFNMNKPTGDTIFGRSGTGESDSFRFFAINSSFYLDYGSGEGYNRLIGGNFYTGITYNIECDNCYIKDIDTNTVLATRDPVSNFSYNYNMFIWGTTAIGSPASGKVYYCKVWKNNILVRDFIPVKKKDNNTICFYDKVTRSYFTNQGSGEFIAGPEL